MEEVKVGRLGPFPRVSKPVFITSSLLIVGFIIFGAFFTETAGAVFSFCALYLLGNESLW